MKTKTLDDILSLEARADQLARDLECFDADRIDANVSRDHLGTFYVNLTVLAKRADRAARLLGKKHDFDDRERAAEAAEKTLIDAIQNVAEVARDSIVTNAQSTRHRDGNYVVREDDMSELREALKSWTDASNAVLASFHK